MAGLGSRSIYLALVLALVGCELDERTLSEETVTVGGRAPTNSTAGSAGANEPGAGGEAALAGASGGGEEAGQDQGGSSGNNGGGTAGSAVGGSTGTSGSNQGGTNPVTDPACPDLDGNQVGDCDETLVENARFDGDVNGWTSELDVEIAWEDRDMSGSGSGSLAVRNKAAGSGPTVSMAGSAQCLPAQGGTNYDVGSRMFIAEGQGSGTSGLVLWFFDQANCSGTQLQPFISPQVGLTEEWSSVAANTNAPDTAASVLIRLVVVKPVEAEPFEVLFDNVLFKKH